MARNSLHTPTLIDVAKVAGVSPITVSRALGRPEVVAAATRKRVQEAVRATGYVPNLAAGALASSRSRLVAIFLPTIANSIFADTVQALTDRLAVAGYQTLLGLTGYQPEQEEALLEAVLGRRPDGIVLTGTEHSKASRQRLARVGIPVVEAWDLCRKPLDMLVGFSHEAVGQAVAQYLLGKGYRRISVVTLDDPRGLRRYRSLVQALAAQGVADVAVEKSFRRRPPWPWAARDWGGCCSARRLARWWCAAPTPSPRVCWPRPPAVACASPRTWRCWASATCLAPPIATRR